MAELYETTTTCSYLSYKNGGQSSIKHRDTCKIYKTMILLNKNQWKPWKSTDLYVFSHRLAFVCSSKLIINNFSYCHGFSRPTIFFKKIWNLVFLYKMRTKFCTPQSEQKNCGLYACEYGSLEIWMVIRHSLCVVQSGYSAFFANQKISWHSLRGRNIREIFTETQGIIFCLWQQV